MLVRDKVYSLIWRVWLVWARTTLALPVVEGSKSILTLSAYVGSVRALAALILVPVRLCA